MQGFKFFVAIDFWNYVFMLKLPLVLESWMHQNKEKLNLELYTYLSQNKNKISEQCVTQALYKMLEWYLQIERQ